MLLEKLKQDYTSAFKNRDSDKVSCLRMLVAEINNREIALRGEGKSLTEDEVLAVLNKELKKRRESAQIYAKNGRQETAEKELLEASIIEAYLPKQLSEEEVTKIISKIKIDNNISDFGSLMKLSMGELKGKADGKMVGDIVKKILS